jgi:hypothetical protein
VLFVRGGRLRLGGGDARFGLSGKKRGPASADDLDRLLYPLAVGGLSTEMRSA